jgi:hypothetical protein
MEACIEDSRRLTSELLEPSRHRSVLGIMNMGTRSALESRCSRKRSTYQTDPHDPNDDFSLLQIGFGRDGLGPVSLESLGLDRTLRSGVEDDSGVGFRGHSGQSLRKLVVCGCI